MAAAGAEMNTLMDAHAEQLHANFADTISTVKGGMDTLTSQQSTMSGLMQRLQESAAREKKFDSEMVTEATAAVDGVQHQVEALKSTHAALMQVGLVHF